MCIGRVVQAVGASQRLKAEARVEVLEAAVAWTQANEVRIENHNAL